MSLRNTKNGAPSACDLTAHQNSKDYSPEIRRGEKTCLILSDTTVVQQGWDMQMETNPHN